ncbi:MAG: hypothetical protein HYS22_06840 [Deltaproteobacteria bacterium]|nr:hypothetical protein [Deltaproteobacteria bacterium]
MRDFKYDVAFSFLGQDEGLAQRLADIINEQYSVFLYNQKQKDLAGKDGEQEFADVFSNQARVVVVLYRQDWGQTTWTRIEETAIRGRAYDHGYDFVLFIPLDDLKKVPVWLPKNRLWCDLQRFGEESAAAIIISRINDQCGEPRPSSPVEEAKKFENDLRFKVELERWRSSSEGVQQVIKAVESLYEDLESQIKLIASEHPTIKFQIDKGRQRDLVVYYPPVSMTFDLNITYGNSLKDVALSVICWKGPIVRSQPAMYFHEPEQISEERFVPQLGRDKVIRWQNSNRLFNQQTIAEYSLKKLMNKIREH